MKEDGRTVLTTRIRPLPIEGGRIVHRPERIQQGVIRDECWIERHLHHLGMAGSVGTNVVVCWVLQLAAQVAGNGLEHPGDLAERLLHTPEAARAKRSFLS